MKKLLLILLLPAFCYGQGDQTIIKVPLDGSGTTESAILHLPDDYGTTTTKYPIMVFLHGMGEGGTNPATIYNSSSAGGPAYYIAQKTFPSSFVNPADGKSYKFIVVSPQSTNGWSTTAAQLEYVLTYLVNTYRVDVSRLYLTGLSAGGEGVMEYVGKLDGNGVKVNATHPVAAVIPLSAVMNAGNIAGYASTIVAGNVHIWGFGSPTDTHGANTLSLLWYVNSLKANYGLSTSYSGGHCCWGQFYTPSFTQNGLNIYQWALQYTQGTSAVVSVPTASAGSNQSITLPVSLLTLNGTASTVTNGTIAKYAWSQQSGPSTAVITSVGSAITTVTTLIAGTYVFKLTITDNNGNTSTATVTETVNAALVVTPPPVISQSIPGLIQAESYSAMSGIQTQSTSDANGGQNVGWIDQGDWMDYTVNAATAGMYAVSFRVATPNTGASFQLRTSSGTVLATVNVPSTGSFQTWQTVTTTAVLPAGVQTLRVYASGAPQWNFNWMLFGGAAVIPGKIEAESYSMMSGVGTQATTDAGGGLNVGWINQGDWMDYTVNAASAGAYTASFRVATPNTGGSLQLKTSTGTVLATVNLPSTGNYQAWQTVSANITLPAGVQTLRVYVSGAPQWNFNWMQFTSGSSASSIQTTAVTATSSQLQTDATSATGTTGAAPSLVLYPNPVQSSFTIQLNNEYMGNMLVQIVDVTGVVRHAYSYNKSQNSMQLNLSAGDLSAGNYFVRVQIGSYSEVRKIVKI
jgi:endoglucanase